MPVVRRGVTVKLNGLYKPILRAFKAYIRQIFEEEYSARSTFQHWSNRILVKEVRTFMKQTLNAPDEMLQYEQVLKMTTLMLPCRSKRLDPRKCCKERNTLVQVFQENSRSLRSEFFADPLVKFLWSKIFILRSPETVTSHLRYIRSSRANGEIQADKFIEDIIRLE